MWCMKVNAMMKRFPCQGYQTCWIDSTSLLLWEVPLSLMILLGSMFFLSPTLDVIRMWQFFSFHSLTMELNEMALSLESISTFYNCALFDQFPYVFLSVFFFYLYCTSYALQWLFKLIWNESHLKQNKQQKQNTKINKKVDNREHYMTNCSSLHFHSFWIIISKFF